MNRETRGKKGIFRKAKPLQGLIDHRKYVSNKTKTSNWYFQNNVHYVPDAILGDMVENFLDILLLLCDILHLYQFCSIGGWITFIANNIIISFPSLTVDL